MAISNLLKQGAPLGWYPDADAETAPDGALLRADNVIRQAGGPELSVRLGSTTQYSSLVGNAQTTGIHSLHGAFLGLNDTLQVVGVSGENVYVNGVLKTSLNTAGSYDTGDVALCDDAYQIFGARGTSKFKWDGTDMNRWDIPGPTEAAAVTAGTTKSLTVMNFGNSDDTSIPSGYSATITTHEGSSTYAAGYAGSANTAVELTPASSSGRASISKKFTADLNCLDIQGGEGGQTDLIDFYVWLSEPRKVDKITVMFGLGTGSDPFIDDYYYFDFNIRNADTVDIKDPKSYGAAAYKKAVSLGQATLSPDDITNIKSPTEVKAILARLGRFAGSRSRERTDAQQTSPAWTHFTVTRGQFNRVGQTAGRDWSTVRAVKFVYTATPGSTDVMRFDDLNIIGGGDKVLTGTFRVVYRFVRSTGNYFELSPISPASADVVLNQQPLVVTLSSASMAAADPQVNQVWVYMYGGFLDNYYRVGVLSSTASSGTWSTDEFDPTTDGTVDDADKRRAIVLELGVGPADYETSSTVVFRVQKTELDAIVENEVLEPGAVSIPDNVIAIAGPWRNRLFLVTAEGWVYPTSQTSPSNCNVYHVLDLRRYGDPLWGAKSGGYIYVGCTKDVVRIEGSGDETEDHLTADIYGIPLNVGNPPIDAAYYTDGSSIVYRSADGLMGITGMTAQPIKPGPTSLLWKGVDRHGISALNIYAGRFRMSMDNQVLYMLASEGSDTSPTSVWRGDTTNSSWARLTYPWTPMSIFRVNRNGQILVGTSDGEIVAIETGTDDDEAAITVRLDTPWLDGGNPLVRKKPLDLQIHADTDGESGTVTLDTSVDDESYTFSTSGDVPIYRINLSDLDEFVKAKLSITGSFNLFTLRFFNLTYRPLPQHTMAIDAYVTPPEPSDIAWLQEVEVDCISPSNLTLKVYLEDTLHTTQTVTVQANKRDVYTVPLPRDTKGRRPRIYIETTASDGGGQIGFECYRLRVRLRGAGNMVELPFQNVSPGQD